MKVILLQVKNGRDFTVVILTGINMQNPISTRFTFYGGLPHFLQTNVRIVPDIKLRVILPTFIPIHYSPAINHSTLPTEEIHAVNFCKQWLPLS